MPELPDLSINPDAPWEKTEHESAKSYAAFVLYMRMLPHKRSLRNCVKEREGTMRFSTLKVFSRWSSKFAWVWRAEQWDLHVAEEERRAHLQAIKEMRTRHLKVGQALFSHGVTRLKALSDDEVKKLPLDDMFRLIEKGVEMEREAIGLEDFEEEIIATHARKEEKFLIQSDTLDATEISTEDLRQLLIHRRKLSPPGTEPDTIIINEQ